MTVQSEDAILAAVQAAMMAVEAPSELKPQPVVRPSRPPVKPVRSVATPLPADEQRPAVPEMKSKPVSEADDLAAVAEAIKGAPAPAARATESKPREFWTIPGVCWHARITTSFGELPVQALRARDPVRVPTGAFVPIAKVDELRLDIDFLSSMPDAQPIRIEAGALGQGRPREAITVSPHQRLAVGQTPHPSEFRTARELLGRPGVTRRPDELVRYMVFHCGVPTTLMIEGVWISTQP